ncbi:MAG: lipopolysaccharide heptosyltransferase family protein [Candidatus Electrothrix sp. AW3_4]|nr:lipopolysaccharide heptosyltransferase family protein [Candidatus Electrothrix gigas]
MSVSNHNIKRIIIYRLGSLGDTIVALPSLHLIRKKYPKAEINLLGTSVSHAAACHPKNILEGSGLINGYLSYPNGLRDPRDLFILRRKIKQLSPQLLIYLTAVRSYLKVYRDVLFFKLCGIKKIIAAPYHANLQNNEWNDRRDCYEYEAVRLTRCLAELGDAHIDNKESWDLRLSPQELYRAQELLRISLTPSKFIACSPTAKVDAKHWGKRRWQEFIRKLYPHFRQYQLILLGAEKDYEECKYVGNSWSGSIVNLCGKTTPRESAAVLKHVDFFVGHDSGPMHLAASVGTPCIAIFSARNKPSVWFPYGSRHKVHYFKTACYGCALDVCTKKECIKSITVDEVLTSCLSILTTNLRRDSLQDQGQLCKPS